jgi:hypothetical protein
LLHRYSRYHSVSNCPNDIYAHNPQLKPSPISSQ